MNGRSVTCFPIRTERPLFKQYETSYSSFCCLDIGRINELENVMEIFKQVFPAGCDVVVRNTEDGVVVSVRGARPEPVWLRGVEGGRGRKPAARGGWCKTAESELRQALLELVRFQPGRGQSHYCRLSLEEGGIKGSQERKERLLADMVKRGELRQVTLPKAVGRRSVVFYAPEQGVALESKTG